MKSIDPRSFQQPAQGLCLFDRESLFNPELPAIDATPDRGVRT
jgi:hypothetical protein